ncbi:MAG TPA: hypothetical protein VKE94_18320 [Gemmataceae bacterium]|nr:hypothetical protein [Gemmataceae bacterium]
MSNFVGDAPVAADPSLHQDLIGLVGLFEHGRTQLADEARTHSAAALRIVSAMIDQAAVLADRHGLALSEELLTEGAAVCGGVQEFQRQTRGSGWFGRRGPSLAPGSKERRQAFANLADKAVALLGRFLAEFESQLDSATTRDAWAGAYRAFLEEMRQALQIPG